MENYTKESMKQAICDKLRLNFGCTVEEATEANVMKACAMVLRDRMSANAVETRSKVRKEKLRQVHYMSLEFLMGRSLMKNAYNLGVLQPMREALEDLGFKPSHIFDMEPDAGLGNGGLGRLAACYLDSLTTLEIPACGYSICYELGLFRQKIVDGQQVELPDNWKDQGDAWIIPRPDEVEEVHFGGTLREFWADDYLHIVNEGYTRVLAIPCDMSIAGYDTKHTNTLRLWDAKSPSPIDMSLFSQGEYLKASEEEAMAEVIAKVLYPEDNHREGKSLRLKQQYFFVSATVQSIVRRHIQTYGTLTNFHEKNVIQINDTHPALVIPELMRILMDDAGLDWDTAWHITVNSVAYTNHTVLAEALERWPQELMQSLLPRIWQILCEIARRWQAKVEAFYHDEAKVRNMAVIWGGEVRMANLCIAGGMAVNGVSALHSDILRHDVFKEAYGMEPEKFKNVTNGIDHRRWLAEINPGLDKLIRDLCDGDEYLLRPGQALPKLDAYADDKEVLLRLEQIKHANKLTFAKWAKKNQGVILNTDAIFDVQVKRLHEYKRQLLNAMHIIHLYLQLRDNPNMDMRPHTFLFGAKAAPGYRRAKAIIRYLNRVAKLVNGDPAMAGKMQVVFVQNYNCSYAEHIIPAADISEQISAAGTEASGTGNMKLMLSGAVTLGTLDGANVEIVEQAGAENNYIFGATVEELAALRDHYNPRALYEADPALRRVVDSLIDGTVETDDEFKELYDSLLTGVDWQRPDPYFLLQDFRAYQEARLKANRDYRDRMAFGRKCLMNVASAGKFSSDHTVRQYADEIWKV